MQKSAKYLVLLYSNSPIPSGCIHCTYDGANCKIWKKSVPILLCELRNQSQYLRNYFHVKYQAFVRSH